nr:MetaGeneMark_Unknown Function [uncultured bacterium]
MDPEAVAAYLAKPIGLIHMGLDLGFQHVHQYFADGELIDRNLAPHLIRYKAKRHLDDEGVVVGELEREALSNNGLYVKVPGFELRILKAADRGLPVPQSQARREYYRQIELWPGWDTPLLTSSESSPLRLVVLWEVGRGYTFAGMRLACPMDGGVDKKSVRAHWYMDLNDPVLDLVASSTSGDGPVFDAMLDLDEKDDLDIQLEPGYGSSDDTAERGR